MGVRLPAGVAVTRPLTAAGAVALLALLWLYSPLRDRLQPADANGANPDTVQHEPLEGFRADAWYLPDDELLGFVEVPGGQFLMGSTTRDTLAFDNERWEGSETQQSVDVPTFFVGRYEVTVAEFRAFVEATGHTTDPQSLREPPSYPVTSVTWSDALAYARWLDKTLREWDGTPPKIKEMLAAGGKVTIPNETEWEKAARGTDGRVYPWGTEPRRDRANFQSSRIAPVGSFACPECPFGLSDMSGNVWEWTRSPFLDQRHGAKEPPANLQADPIFVIRGGSFGDPPRLVRVALRGGGDPSVRRPFIGFRVVISES